MNLKRKTTKKNLKFFKISKKKKLFQNPNNIQIYINIY